MNDLFDIMKIALSYRPVEEMIRKHPRAAKKLRNLKKWRRRFGPDMTLTELIEEQVFKPNPFLKTLNVEVKE